MIRRSATLFGAVAALVASLAVPSHAIEARLARKLDDARDVIEMARSSDGISIPAAVLARARAVAIFPGTIKAGFIFGLRAGDGVVLSRDDQGGWSAPAFYSLASASGGLQAGIQSVDVVLVIMNDRGLRALLKNKTTLGGDINITAGPASASGEAVTDLALRSEVLAYTRARGIFAGVSLQGGSIAPSRRMNRSAYGRDIDVDEIIMQRGVAAPAEAEGLIRSLTNYR